MSILRTDKLPLPDQQAMDWSTGRTPDIKGFIVAGGRNNMASENAPNQQGAAGNRAP
jgi:hypothetical protein